MTASLFQHFREDARFYRQIKYGRSKGFLLLSWTLLTSPGLWMLTFHRLGYYCRFNRNFHSPIWWVARLMVAAGAYFIALVNKSDLLSDCEITGPVYLSDKGYYMLGAQHVGRGSVLHQHLTFGMAVANGKPERPVVGENVWIGPNCVIAGQLEIGDGATILPDSYLTYSVPAHTVVKGNPARIIRKDFDNSTLRQSLAVVNDIPPLQT